MRQKLYFLLTLFSAGLLAASCGSDEGTPTPKEDPDAFKGTLTHDGRTQDVTRGAFYYNASSDYYRVLVSPVRAESGTTIDETLELLEIEMPGDLMGTELDMATDDLWGAYAMLYIGYRKNFTYYDPFLGYLGGENPGPDHRNGTIKVTRRENSNYFEVEIKDMELHDGTLLSCSAEGVMQSQNYHHFEGGLEGTADYVWEWEDERFDEFDGAHRFTTASLHYMRGYSGDDGHGETQMEIYGTTEDGDTQFQFSFRLIHPEMNLASKTYEIVYDGEGNLDTEATTLADVHFSNSTYIPTVPDTFFQFDYAGITEGSVTIEVSERVLKVKLNGDFDEVYHLSPAEFVFDYTNLL